MYVIYICYTIPQICCLYKETTEWVNNEYLILKAIMKEKEKHNIELEQAYIRKF